MDRWILGFISFLICGANLLMPSQAQAQLFPFAFLQQQNASVTYVTNATDATDTGTYTFSSVNIGTPNSDRNILIGVTSRSGSTYTISGVTVNGTAATAVYQHIDSGSVAGFYLIPLKTGSTATIVVTFTGSMVRAGIGIWNLRGLKSTTAFATASFYSGSLNTSLNVPAGGVAVGMFFNGTTGGSGIPANWTGLTSNFDTFLTDASLNAEVSGASMSTVPAITPRSISVSPSSNSYGEGAVVSFH